MVKWPSRIPILATFLDFTGFLGSYSHVNKGFVLDGHGNIEPG